MLVSLLQMMGFPLGLPPAVGGAPQGRGQKPAIRVGVPDNQGITRTDEGHPND